MTINQHPEATSPVIRTIRPGQFPGITFQADGGDAGGSTGDQGGNADEGQGAPKGIELTQEKLDEIINGAFKRGAAKAEKGLTSKVAELEAELAKYKQPKGKDSEQKGGTDGEAQRDEIKRLLAQKDEEASSKVKAAEEKAQRLLAKERNAALVSAAAKAGVMRSAIEDVAALAAGGIGHDEDGNLIVLNANGTARIGAKGDPMTVEEYLKEWVSARPHFLEGTAGNGAGSSTRGGGGAAGTFTRAQIADPAFYRANKDAIRKAIEDGRIAD